MRRILLITNATAGSADETAVQAALEVMRAQLEVEVVATSGLDDLRAALRRRDGRPVVVAGGDGSLRALVAALDDLGELRGADGSRTAPTVGLLPLGTGNDFSRAVAIPRDPAEAAAVVATAVVADDSAVDVDILRDDTGAVVVNVAHVGVGADAGSRAVPWKARLSPFGLGVVAYAVGAVLAVVRSEGWRLDVVADGCRLSRGRRRVLQVAVANGMTIGGGAEIAPDSDVADGLADVSVSYATGPLARIGYGIAMRRGRHRERDDVVSVRAREVTVRAVRGTFQVNSDGEISGPLTERSWRVEPRAYRMLTGPVVGDER